MSSRDNGTSALRPRVLVIDDDEIARAVMKEILGEEFEVLTTGSAETGLEMARQILPDVVLLDYKMPGMDGHEALAEIRRAPELADTPIIFVTADGRDELEVHSIELGAVDFVTKPVHAKILITRIKSHIEIKHRQDGLRKFALIDGLTGIPNRRQFDETLDREWRRTMRDGGWLSLAMIDIDYFKQFNDTYGHSAGDDCFKSVAELIVSCLQRPADLAARFGGEEFACVLPQTDLPGAKLVGDSLYQGMRNAAIPHTQSEVAEHLTVSIGVVSVSSDSDVQAVGIIEAADRLLYEAKEGGRNQVRASTLTLGPKNA